MKKEYQTVILAGLLHDIGKFLQIGTGSSSLRTKNEQPAISANFVKTNSKVFNKVSDIDLLTTLIQRDHEIRNFSSEICDRQTETDIRPLVYLVNTADNYSSMEQDKQTDVYRDYKTVSLASIFGSLKLTHPIPEIYHYKLHQLDPSKAFPQPLKRLDVKQASCFLSNFKHEFDTMVETIDCTNFDCLYTHLLSLLQRYTWCVPANIQEQIPDISLYDHLRTTSAIAACLYRYHKETGTLNERDLADDKVNKFRLVVGDFSGIQHYIFDIANIGVGGVAKRMRARSFYLSVLVEAISHMFIHKFNLPFTNIIMSSGGKFYVLLPNLPDSAETVETIQNELDYWSVSQFGGEIVVNIAQKVFNGQLFSSFGDVLDEISKELNKRKGSPLQGYLVKDDKWQAKRFSIDTTFGELGLCQSCNKMAATNIDDKGNRLCEQCTRDQRMGLLLPFASYIAFSKTGLPIKFSTNTFSLIDSYSMTFFNDVPPMDYSGYLVYKLNDSNIKDVTNHPVLTKFIANYIPIANEENCNFCAGCNDEVKPMPGSPMYFDCLANRAKGRKLLGYLKADVDNLGNLFIFGMKDKVSNRNSISRIATMSRMLDLFFSGRIDQLLNANFTSCYTVYSGGDDLLIIGPWDEVVGLALKVCDEFSQFTNNNENITISAGIGMFKPTVPISRSVMVADQALENSKEIVLKGEEESRNQFTFLGRTMKWEKAQVLIKMAEQLAHWYKMDKISSGLLRKLLILSKMHQRYYYLGEIKGLKYLPLLTYTITQYFSNRDDCVSEEFEVRSWVENLKQLDHDFTVYLDFLVKYAFLAKE